MTASVTHGRALRYAEGSARGLLHHYPGHSHDPMDGAAQLWGKTIREGGYVPPSAVTARLARVILAKGYATEAQMLAKGIRP
jgi:hypothetical protein